MSTAPREDSNTPPPAAVLRLLRAAGYVEVELPNRQPWWKAPSGATGPWEEAVDRFRAELVHLRQVAALSPKSAWKTTELWTAVVSLLGVLGPGIGMLSGQLDWVPAEHREQVGVSLIALSGVVTWAYTRARTVQKVLAAAQQEKALRDGPQAPPDGGVA